MSPIVRISMLVVGFMVISNMLPTEVQCQEDKAAFEATISGLEKVFEPREYASKDGSVLRYRLLKPIDYEFGKKYPLVILLHGAGERGDDNRSQLKHGAKDFANEENRRRYPAYVLVPQCPSEEKWVDVDWKRMSHSLPETPTSSMKLVRELIDVMIESAGIDTQRVYITGLSMGGFGTWDAISRFPGLFAAAIPICGGGDPAQAKNYLDIPIWAFHGEIDQAVKVERSREMVEALRQLNGKIEYTEYPNVPHDSWTKTYENPEVLAWLFAQVKK